MDSPATSRMSVDSLAHRPTSPFSQQDVEAFRWGRRGSTASSVSMNSLAELRSARDISKNAIANLLDNPTSRAVLPRPTTRDIPSVTLTNIPKVKLSEFSNYLSLSSEYEKYRRAKDEEFEEHLRIAQSPESTLSDLDILRNGSALTPVEGRSRPGTAQGDGYFAHHGSKRGSIRRHSLAMTPLSTVPRVYFDDNFHLEKARTFDVVSERSHVIQTPLPDDADDIPALAGRKALATNAILQEKLSWYMDTVEVHLIKEISSASTGFFAALGSLRELHTEAEAAVEKIHSLRDELGSLDRDQALTGLDIVRLRRRRANVEKLATTVDQIVLVLDKTAQIEADLDGNDLARGMTTIEETEALIEGKTADGGSYIDLTGVKALGAVRTDITALRNQVGKAYESKFVDTLLNDLRNHAKQVESSDTLYRFYTTYMRQQNRAVKSDETTRQVSHSYLQLPEELRSQLLAHLDGLRRAQTVEGAVQAYKEAVMKETKSMIKRNMPSDDDTTSVMSGRSNLTGSGGRSTAEKSSSLARSLRNLGPREAEDMIVRVYTSLSEVLRRLGAQQKLLLDVTSGMNSILSPRNTMAFANGIPTSPAPPQTPTAATDSFSAFYSMDISELISVAIDTAQHQMIKVLKVRAEQNSHLSLGDFLRFFMLNKLFSSECEALSGKVTSGLQSLINSQIKEFVAVFHQENIKQLASVIEKDKWEAKDFDNVEKERLGRILESATKDAESWSVWAKVYDEPPEPPVVEDRGPGAKVRTAVIDGQNYILPESGLAILRSIETYECLFAMIPGSTADVATNMLEFLKLFNSRVCQVILGAGATKSAGLKHITTKHLALASQALSIVISVIPYIRECIRRHIGPAASGGTLLPEFDRVRRNYQEHQAEIHSKLISIMSDRLMAHVRTIRGVDWDGTDPGKVNTYMETLVKETSTLHKVLGRHLPEEILLSIMQPVFAVYKKRLSEVYESATIRTNGGKQRLLRDAQYFRDKMSKLDGSETTGEEILATARAKALTAAAGPAAAATTTTNTATTSEAKTNGDAKAAEVPKADTATTVVSEKMAEGDAPGQAAETKAAATA